MAHTKCLFCSQLISAFRTKSEFESVASVWLRGIFGVSGGAANQSANMPPPSADSSTDSTRKHRLWDEIGTETEAKTFLAGFHSPVQKILYVGCGRRISWCCCFSWCRNKYIWWIL